MFKGVVFARLAGLFGICAFTLMAADATPDRSCWLRDAAAPGASTVYALCEQGGLWVSTDAGATWVKRETGSAERLRAISFLDVSRGFVLGDKGTLLVTDDGGNKWQPRPLDTKERL